MLFIVKTPFPGASEVTLYQDRWENHIVANHVAMTGKEEVVKAIVSAPAMVLPPGINHPAHYVTFVNPAHTGVGKTPIGVVVDTQLGSVVTAYQNRSLKFIDSRRALWLP